MGEYVMGFIWAHFVRSEEPSVRPTREFWLGLTGGYRRLALAWTWSCAGWISGTYSGM